MTDVILATAADLAAEAAIRAAGDTTRVANVQTKSYALALSDAGKAVEMDAATATTVTVPPDSAVAFPTGTVVEVVRIGAGALTVAAGEGVTLASSGYIATVNGVALLRKRAANIWIAQDVAPVGSYLPSAQKGAAAGVGVLGTDSRPPASYGNFADVTRAPYYATGDGATDDTAAIQACLDANLRVLFPKPVAAYKVGQLTLRPGHWIVGAARSGDNTTGLLTKIDSQVSGFSQTPAAFRIAAGGVGLGAGITMEGLWVQGQAVKQTDRTYQGFPSYGIYGGSQVSDLVLRDCRISGFNYNVWLMDAVRCHLERLLLTGSVNGNVVFYGGCTDVVLASSTLRVPNEGGSADPAATLQNLWLRDRVSPLIMSDISIRDCLIDEVVRGRQTVIPATVRIDKATDVLLDGVRVYMPLGGGSGYGIKIGPYAERVRLRAVRVLPYASDAVHVPVQTILIDAAAAGCVLEDVSTVANGGGDILDNATDTVWRNVNGATPEIDAAVGRLRSAGYIGSNFALDATMALPLDWIVCAVPLRVARRGKITELAIEVTAAGSSDAVIRLGVYADDGSGYPGALVVDAGTVTGASTGVKTVAVSLPLRPGRYWLAAVHQVGQTAATVRGGQSPDPPIVSTAWQTWTPGAFQSASGNARVALPATFSAAENVSRSGPLVRARMM